MGNTKKRRTATRTRKRPEPTVTVRVVRAPALPPFDRVLDSAMASIATHLVTSGEHTAEAYKQLALANVEHNRALNQLARLMEIRRGKASEMKIEYELAAEYGTDPGRVHTEVVD